MIEETAGLGIADIALLELIEEKITWESIEEEAEKTPTA